MRRAPKEIAGTSACLILLVAGCHNAPPMSGTPASESEAAALQSDSAESRGVRREQIVYGTRGVDVIASSRRMAADLAALLHAADQPDPPVIRLGEVINSTSLPSSSFGAFNRQLIDNLRAAGPQSHLSFVIDKDASGGQTAPQFVLRSEVYDVGSFPDRLFLVDYELRRVEPADPAAASSSVLWAKRYRVTEP